MHKVPLAALGACRDESTGHNTGISLLLGSIHFLGGGRAGGIPIDSNVKYSGPSHS